MIRDDVFVLSRRQVAVDLGSYRVVPDLPWTDCRHVPATARTEVTAAWYRRRRGVTAVCWGTLHSLRDPGDVPATVGEFLDRQALGRYGPDTRVRWDASSLWTARGVTYDDATRVLDEVLRPMLDQLDRDGSPLLPPGWEGWWRWRPDEA